MTSREEWRRKLKNRALLKRKGLGAGGDPQPPTGLQLVPPEESK